MAIEAAVLDRDERLRQVGRQLLERHVGAAHVAARRQDPAVDADDLDRRRPLGNFAATGSAAGGGDPRERADRDDHAPEPEHDAPVEQPRQQRAAAPAAAPTALALAAGGRAGLGARPRRRRAVVVGGARLGLRARCSAIWLGGGGRTVVGGGPQVGVRRLVRVELRLAPRARLSPSRPHASRPVDQPRGHGRERGLRGGYRATAVQKVPRTQWYWLAWSSPRPHCARAWRRRRRWARTAPTARA